MEHPLEQKIPSRNSLCIGHYGRGKTNIPRAQLRSYKERPRHLCKVTRAFFIGALRRSLRVYFSTLRMGSRAIPRQSRLHPPHRAYFTLRTEFPSPHIQSILIPQVKPPKTYALTPSDCTHSPHVCNNLYLCPANLGATYASEVFTKQRI